MLFDMTLYIQDVVWYINCVVGTCPCVYNIAVLLIHLPVCGMLTLDDLCSLGEDWIKVVGVNPTFWLNYLFFTNPYHWNGTVGNNGVLLFQSFLTSICKCLA